MERERSNDEPENSKLPDRLAATLGPLTQDALDHRVRRQLLRALGDSEQPTSPSEVATTLPGVSVGSIGYHAQVLEVLGKVHVAATQPVGAGFSRLYASSVADDPQVMLVLRVMREDDALATLG